MSESSFSESELEAAVGRLEDADRLRAAEERVSAVAPALQRVLAGSMAAGGWFGDSHRAELERIAKIEDPDERSKSIDLLVAEEARIAMMVGAAVGWALAEELGAGAGEGSHPQGDPDPQTRSKES